MSLRFWNQSKLTGFNPSKVIEGAQIMRLLVLSVTLASATLLTMGQMTSTIRTANTTTPSPTKKSSSEEASQNCPDVEPLRKQVAQLNSEVMRLKRKVAELEKDRSVQIIQDQLEKEQQRGEALQLHLLEIAEKEGSLVARLDQINHELNPETIERNLAGVGSVHPENVRDEVRRRLASEKTRIQTQLDLLKQDQRRTQASLATTDAAIQRLKQKLLEAQRP